MSDLKLVPIPTEAIEATAAFWFPFVEAIARRSGDHAGELVRQVMENEVQVMLVWDDCAKEARALAGSRLLARGDDTVGEICWLTGQDRDGWMGLFPQFEEYHREHLHCTAMRAIARPGWRRVLRDRGYRLTHVVMDRSL